MHGHHRLLAKHLLPVLMVLTLLVFGSNRLAGGGPLAWFGRAWLLLVHWGGLFSVLLLRLLAFHALILLLLLRVSLRILSCSRRCSCFGSWLE